MALARIITRSQTCSRELALDLLARGYAVEIVTPDKVPDNIADLELRVDAGPGDQLTASVEAHDGERSASLEFVHHLRAPMGAFKRRPPEPREAPQFSDEPVSFNAEPVTADIELPAETPQLEFRAVSPVIEIPLDPGLNSKEEARPAVPQIPSSPSPVELPGHFAVDDVPVSRPTVVQPLTVPSTPSAQSRDRSAEWRWRAGLTFASLVLLAAVLGFGIHTGKPAAQSSEALPVEKTAAPSTGVNLPSAIIADKDLAKDLGQASVVATPSPAVSAEANPSQAPKEAQVAKVGAPTASRRTAATRRHGDELIAPDTVTYLDKRFEPAPKAEQAKAVPRRHPKSRKRGGVIAANTVTYLNKPAPKASK